MKLQFTDFALYLLMFSMRMALILMLLSVNWITLTRIKRVVHISGRSSGRKGADDAMVR